MSVSPKDLEELRSLNMSHESFRRLTAGYLHQWLKHEKVTLIHPDDIYDALTTFSASVGGNIGIAVELHEAGFKPR